MSSLDGVQALAMGQTQRSTRKMIGAVVVGIVFWFLYGGFGFILGVPIVLLSLVSMVLILMSKEAQRHS